jgi:hypothetical protein
VLPGDMHAWELAGEGGGGGPLGGGEGGPLKNPLDPLDGSPGGGGGPGGGPGCLETERAVGVGEVSSVVVAVASLFIGGLILSSLY